MAAVRAVELLLTFVTVGKAGGGPQFCSAAPARKVNPATTTASHYGENMAKWRSIWEISVGAGCESRWEHPTPANMKR